MRSLVFSDSHGDIRYMLDTVRLMRPDRIFHLGDCVRDAHALMSHFPEIAVTAVCGNNDFGVREPEYVKTDFAGTRLLITHGHRFSVKQDLSRLRDAAKSSSCRAVLFGHTHIPHESDEDGILLLNPGAAGYCDKSCLLMIGEDGHLRYKHMRL